MGVAYIRNVRSVFLRLRDANLGWCLWHAGAVHGKCDDYGQQRMIFFLLMVEPCTA